MTQQLAVSLLIGLNFVVFVGVQASRIIFSLYALSLGGTASTVGAILATLFIFPVLLSWPVGAISDRFGAKRVLIPSILAGALGMSIPYFLPSLASLYIAGALIGLVITTVMVAVQNLIGVLSAPADRARNFSNLTLFGSATIFAGPLLAGFFIDHFGHAAACLFVAAMFVLGIAALGLWGRLLPKGKPVTRARTNLLATLTDRRLWPMFIVSSLSQVGMDVYQAFVPIQGHSMGLSASIIGVVIAAFSVGMMSVRAILQPLLRLARGEARLLPMAFSVALFAFVLIPLAPGPISLATVGFCFGLTLGAIQPLILMLMFESAEEGRAGEVIGLRLTINNIARIVTPAVFGVVASALGLKVVFWATAGLMGAAAAAAKPRR